MKEDDNPKEVNTNLVDASPSLINYSKKLPEYSCDSDNLFSSKNIHLNKNKAK